MSSTRVVCFGNPLHGDDGFGAHVCRRLRERGIPAIDAGTAGLNALAHFENCAKAVIVDALRTGGSPGTVHRLRACDLRPAGGEFSLHELGVNTLLAALSAQPHEAPEIVLIGAEVGHISPFTDCLSPALEAALPAAVDRVILEIGRRPHKLPAGPRRRADGR